MKQQPLELKELTNALQSYTVRKVFWDMMKHCGAFSQSYQSDPYLANFLLGRRNVGLWLMGEIDSAGEEWLLMMMREAAQREKDLEENNGRTNDSD